jgi:hypothetical protein
MCTGLASPGNHAELLNIGMSRTSPSAVGDEEPDTRLSRTGNIVHQKNPSAKQNDKLLTL